MADIQSEPQMEDNQEHINGDSLQDKMLLPCTVWITRLPLTTTYKDIFFKIKNIGPIMGCQLYSPDPSDPKYAYAVVHFFQYRGASNLYHRWRTQGLVINGRRTAVKWHQELYEPFTFTEGESRGLRIKGPKCIVNRRVLEAIWREEFQWNADSSIDLGLGEVVYFFSCWDHSRRAKDILLKDLSTVLTAEYEPDPCGNPSRRGSRWDGKRW